MNRSSQAIAEMSALGAILPGEQAERSALSLARGGAAYLGIDPTAPGLHLGHLAPLLALRRLALAGVPTVLLVGGATARIGDPTGRDAARPPLSPEALSSNSRAVAAEAAALVPGALVLDNAEWAASLSLLDFLELSSRIPLGFLLRLSSLRDRMSKGEGAAVSEALYPLMQALDFLHLSDRHGVSVQVGGEDQWGNISAGIELHARSRPGQAPLSALLVPLILRADGTKMGKTAGGAVWLSPLRTSDYDFHQFFLRCPDRDFPRLLPLWPGDPAWAAEARRLRGADLNPAKELLADEVTRLVRGDSGLLAAREAARAVFGDGRAGGEAMRVAPGTPLARILVDSGHAASLSEARRLIRGRGVSLNGVRAEDPHAVLSEGAHDIRVGRREPLRVAAIPS